MTLIQDWIYGNKLLFIKQSLLDKKRTKRSSNTVSVTTNDGLLLSQVDRKMSGSNLSLT